MKSIPTLAPASGAAGATPIQKMYSQKSDRFSKTSNNRITTDLISLLSKLIKNGQLEIYENGVCHSKDIIIYDKITFHIKTDTPMDDNQVTLLY